MDNSTYYVIIYWIDEELEKEFNTKQDAMKFISMYNGWEKVEIIKIEN